jgi:hypothetical protein
MKEQAMSGERPSHRCFVVEGREGPNGKEAFWLPIGSAWRHKDGKGFNLQLSALPANGGRIVLREFTEEEAAPESKSPVPMNKGRQGSVQAKAR